MPRGPIHRLATEMQSRKRHKIAHRMCEIVLPGACVKSECSRDRAFRTRLQCNRILEIHSCLESDIGISRQAARTQYRFLP
jgi:hypothetical protein